ncbi:MAG: hypothetical protein ACOYOV_16755, partial [Bacteroidales bacterium]
MKKFLVYVIPIFFIVTNLYSQSIPSYVPQNGLVGWWPFNGNANDESGNSNNGTINGATLSTDRFGNTNKSYEFDGKSNYISLPSLDKMQYNPVTYSLWFLDYSLVPNQNGRADGRALIGRDLCGWEKGIIPQGILLIWNEP